VNLTTKTSSVSENSVAVILHAAPNVGCTRRHASVDLDRARRKLWLRPMGQPSGAWAAPSQAN
jgi:hypothetical protein